MTRLTEFLVIGGGPAGCSAAIVLAQSGHDVIVVEETRYDQTRIGETLASTSTPLLNRLGIATDRVSQCGVRCPGTVSVWGSDEPYRNDALFDPYGEGLHLDRLAFDQLIAEQAVTAGAEVRLGERVRNCGRIGHNWVVTMNDQNVDREIQASYVIDATGRKPWSGRLAGRRTYDRQVAFVRFYDRSDKSRLDRWTWTETTEFGWWYSAALLGNRIAVAYFTDADLLHAPKDERSERFEELLQQTRWIRERLRDSLAVSPPQIVAASSTIAVPIAGDHWIAVGDAASTIDPLSSQGIYYAMSTGITAAEALNSPNRELAVENYTKVIANRFQSDFATRKDFCLRERRWPDSIFWRRRHESDAEMPQTLELLSQ